MSDIPDFQVIRSRRRTIALQINAYGNLVVKTPPLVPMFIIRKYVQDNSDWIEKHLKVVGQSRINNSQKMQQGDEFRYLGNVYQLCIGNYKEIVCTNKLYFPQFLLFRAEKELRQWYINHAKKIISQRVDYHARLMGKTYKSISYSDTISQWGSCSYDNALHFNWRLIMAPLLVIDYVVVHELTHTTVKGHGERFWREVKIYKPAYKQYVKWLKNNSHSIHSV